MQVKIGEIQDYVSLITVIERKDFEDKSADILARVMLPIEEVLKKAGVTIQDVDLVELIGGGIRVPKV
jgi:molecular chaperone DnaK (HSP70)